MLEPVTCLQTTVLFACVSMYCQQSGDPVGQWLLLQGLAVVGVALGLAISSASTTEDVAATATPIVLVPQIILAGTIAPLKGLAEILAASFIAVYWGHRAMTALLPAEVAKLAGITQTSAVTAFLFLLGHFVFFAGIAFVLLVFQDRGEKRYRRAIVKWLKTRVKAHP